jgi:31-O-methyltransferase
MSKLRRVPLPAFPTVWAHNAFEAEVLYREIVTEQTYERHGISIQPGNTVFDVGANIGVFSLHLSRTYEGLTVHAFEPIPDIFEALQKNLQEHAPSVVAHQVGLSDRQGEAVFDFDRFTTIASSMHPDVFQKGAIQGLSAFTWTAAGLRDFEKIGPRRWVSLARKGLEVPGLRYAVFSALAVIGIAREIRKRLYLNKRHCKLQTLSDALLLAGVDVVDLIKIDVEGAEEAVLLGIAERDWPRLRQFVIEVHDVDGRLDRISRLLQDRGYWVKNAREDWAIHDLLGISAIYAGRN